MLIQKIKILCTIVLHKHEERVRFIVNNIEDFYDEFLQFKKDKLGNKRKNKQQYLAQFGEYWHRTINPPKDELKTIQKRINSYLINHLELPAYAYGGIKGKDNILNAQYHKGQKYIFQTDLKDFFPHITNKMVYAMFVERGFSPDVASLLTKLTTYKGHLPQGAPTSTTIANLVFIPVGKKIQSIAEREGLRFTTFVDDITISAQNDFKAVIPEILDVIQPQEAKGFKISHAKTTYKSGITDVTGVKMMNNSLAVPEKIRKRIEEEQNLNTLRGRGLLNYANRIKKISKTNKKKADK